jgi:WD40 repeat protein
MRKFVFLSLLLLVMILPAKANNEYQSSENSAPYFQEVDRIERDLLLRGNFSEYFAFSPDGQRIAAAATETTINVWDVETGEVVHTLEHTSTSVSWSPDGALVAAGSDEGILRLWNVQSGILWFELEGYSGRHITWSPDSTQFVTNAMKIFDSQTGELILQLGSNWGIPYEAHWSPDGTMIATTSGWEGQYLNIWSITGERLDTYWAGVSAAWSPDSTRLASTAQIRDVATGLPTTIIRELAYEIAWHPGGEWIASTGNAGQIYLWDAATGELVTMWQYEDCLINGFAWSPNGERFAVNCIQQEPAHSNDLIIRERIR